MRSNGLVPAKVFVVLFMAILLAVIAWIASFIYSLASGIKAGDLVWVLGILVFLAIVAYIWRRRKQKHSPATATVLVTAKKESGKKKEPLPYAWLTRLLVVVFLVGVGLLVFIPNETVAFYNRMHRSVVNYLSSDKTSLSLCTAELVDVPSIGAKATGQQLLDQTSALRLTLSVTRVERGGLMRNNEGIWFGFPVVASTDAGVKRGEIVFSGHCTTTNATREFKGKADLDLPGLGTQKVDATLTYRGNNTWQLVLDEGSSSPDNRPKGFAYHIRVE